MARAALNWNVLDLAREAKVGASTIVRFEAERGKSNPATIMAIERALEAAGVEFTNGDQPGVRLKKKPEPETSP
jgi:ribosome-binding protein aMBF1 (putative translation factor)